MIKELNCQVWWYSTWEAEIVGSGVQEWPGLLGKNLSQKTRKKNYTHHRNLGKYMNLKGKTGITDISCSQTTK
jgi:hypothetical protein